MKLVWCVLKRKKKKKKIRALSLRRCDTCELLQLITFKFLGFMRLGIVMSYVNYHLANQFLSGKSSNLALNLSGKFLIFLANLGTFSSSHNPVLVLT